jgi:hypothetical protein
MLVSGLNGILPAIAAGYLITVFLSFVFLDGQYNPVSPTLSAVFENEIYAVLLQTALLALLGFIYGAAMLIWDIDEWNYIKQTGVFFLICSIAVLLIGYFLQWMPRNLVGALTFYGIYIVGFFIIWIINFFIWKAKIRKIDDELKRHK